MDARTLEALKGSIAKWQAIVDGTGEDHGTLNCPLCGLFAFPVANGCEGCPVKDRTGEMGCKGTPYDAYDYAVDHDDDSAHEAAIAELAFLKSLLPEGETP